MPDKSQLRHIGDIDDKDLAYWMGQVDANLRSVRSMLENLIESDKQERATFRGWQVAIEKTLASHTQQFATSEKRIADIEQDVSDIKSKGGPGNNGDKFVSWPWIRDKLVVPVIVWGIILLLAYVVSHSIAVP